MDWKLICEIGIKILTATVAGAAVFVGISKSMTESDARKKKREQQPKAEENSSGCVFDPCQPPMQPQSEVKDEPVVLTSMRATQDTCGKLFAFVQSLTMVTENLTRIFGGNAGQYYPGSQPYYQDPWSYRQPVNAGCGQTWTRISPFIIEAGPANPNSRGFYPGY